jgi:hypothetical protein
MLREFKARFKFHTPTKTGAESGLGKKNRPTRGFLGGQMDFSG